MLTRSTSIVPRTTHFFSPKYLLTEPILVVIDFITALWFGVVGGCIGSFLNVVAYRMPLGISVVWKPSYCPKCNHPIRARHNVPVLGWLMLRGKCRDCGEPISPRYAIVEFLMGLAFFVLAYVELFSGGANLPGGPITPFTGAVGNVWNPQWILIGLYAFHCLLISILTCLSLMNRDRQEIPLKMMVCVLLLGLIPPLLGSHLYPALPIAANFGKVLLSGLGGLATGAALGILLLWKSSALQRTQAKCHLSMLAVVGVFLGWQAVLYIWAVTMVSGIAWGFVRTWFGKPHRPDFKVTISMIWLVLATFLLILAWRPITELVPL